MSFAREPSPERTGQHAPPELGANTPEKQERQRNHEQAVQALNRIGVPVEFTDSIRWFTAKHSKAYNGIKTYGLSESDLNIGEGQDSQEQQEQHGQQVRAHEMMHLYWSSLINPKLNLPLPKDIDFGAVAEEHQDELAYWNITQNTAKKLTALSDYTFHHHLPGSAERAIAAINADPEKFLQFMQDRSENSVPFAYGLASTLEYLEGITTDEFYATTGLGKSFEEGLVNYLSSSAIYGNDTTKWQKQDDERAMFYRDRLHQVFGGPEHVVAFLKENGVSAFVDRVRAEIQHLPAQESAEAMPKTETEKLLYAVYVLRAEGQGMWVDTKYVTPDYKAQCEVATRYLEDRLKTEGDQPSYLRDFWGVVESIPHYDGTTRTSTSEQWAFLPKGEDGRMASEQYVTELLQAYGLTTLDEILNQPSTFLRNLQTGTSKTWTPLPQGAGFTEVPQHFEVVSVLEQAKEGTQLGELLKSLNVRLILKLDPTDNYYTGDNQVTVKYQLVCHPELAYPEEMESGTDTSRKKGDADDLEAPTELETLSALMHVLKGGTGKDMKRLGPDDVPPVLRAKKTPPDAPGMEREVDTPEWVRNAMDLSVLFQYLTQHRELTDSEWETVARSLSRPQAQVLLELVRENQYALTGTSGQRESERQQTATRYREQERLRVTEG